MIHPMDEGPTEIRITNSRTGGQKGTKPQRFSLLPWDILWEVSELFAIGAEKYSDRNWEKGYDWSLSYEALMRHLTQWWQFREDYDDQTKCHHVTSVIFHAMALLRFAREFPELDDRPSGRPADHTEACPLPPPPPVRAEAGSWDALRERALNATRERALNATWEGARNA